MDLLQKGDVLVCDMAGGKVEDGVIAGDNLAVAIFQATGNGFVVQGGT
jgi:regulator of RNase E activity RraA